MVVLACEIAAVAVIAGISTWRTRAARAETHDLEDLAAARRAARRIALADNPTGAADQATLAAQVARIEELDPYGAEPEHLERMLDRHVELAVALRRVSQSDDLSRARRQRASRDPRPALVHELQEIHALIGDLLARIELPDEPPEHDAIAAYVASLSARTPLSAATPRSTAV